MRDTKKKTVVRKRQINVLLMSHGSIHKCHISSNNKLCHASKSQHLLHILHVTKFTMNLTRCTVSEKSETTV